MFSSVSPFWKNLLLLSATDGFLKHKEKKMKKIHLFLDQNSFSPAGVGGHRTHDHRNKSN